MCVNAPVTLSSPLNNLVISRLFNLLQPISTLFNYLCLVTMAIRKIVLFKHDSELGNAPAHKLFDAVSVVKHENVEFPRSIQDYDITIHHDLIPAGVTVEEIDC